MPSELLIADSYGDEDTVERGTDENRREYLIVDDLCDEESEKPKNTKNKTNYGEISDSIEFKNFTDDLKKIYDTKPQETSSFFTSKISTERCCSKEKATQNSDPLVCTMSHSSNSSHNQVIKDQLQELTNVIKEFAKFTSEKSNPSTDTNNVFMKDQLDELKDVVKQGFNEMVSTLKSLAVDQQDMHEELSERKLDSLNKKVSEIANMIDCIKSRHCKLNCYHGYQ